MLICNVCDIMFMLPNMLSKRGTYDDYDDDEDDQTNSRSQETIPSLEEYRKKLNNII